MTTIVFILAVANLVVAVQEPGEVSPAEHPAIRWSMGQGAQGEDEPGQHLEWGFSVEPGGHEVVDLDVRLPYRVGVTHDEGQARLSSRFVASVDGQRLGSVTHSTTATPGDGNSSWTDSIDLGSQLGRLVVERDADDGPFVLLLALDWSRVQTDPDSTRFDVEIGPVHLELVQLSGLPGCDALDCARVLFVGALVVQGGAVFWVMTRWHKNEDPGDAGPGASRHGPAGPVRPTDKKK